MKKMPSIKTNRIKEGIIIFINLSSDQRAHFDQLAKKAKFQDIDSFLANQIEKAFIALDISQYKE